MVTNAGVSCSVHTWNDNFRDSLPHLNAVVTPETCSVYVAFVCVCVCVCVRKREDCKQAECNVIGGA